MTGFRNIFRNISATAVCKAATAVTGVAAACCMTGCDVHEFPYDRATVNVVATPSSVITRPSFPAVTTASWPAI